MTKKMLVKALVKRKGCCHGANVSFSRLKLVWLISRLKMSKNAFLPESSRCQIQFTFEPSYSGISQCFNAKRRVSTPVFVVLKFGRLEAKMCQTFVRKRYKTSSHCGRSGLDTGTERPLLASLSVTQRYCRPSREDNAM